MFVVFNWMLMAWAFSSGRLRTDCIPLLGHVALQMCFIVNLACKDRSSISYVLQYLLFNFSLPYHSSYLNNKIVFFIDVNLWKAWSFHFHFLPLFPPNCSEVVHSDEWGRAPISSIRGFNYCVSFIDITIGYILQTLCSASHFLCGSMLV